MLTRFRTALRLALLLGLIALFSFFAAPAFAGGWAVITLDELPAGVVAGEPLAIGFTVLQHGHTPMTGLDPTVTATLSKDQRFVVHAKPEGKAGHYTAVLTFPTEGEWSWSIQTFSMDQPMPALHVAAPAARSEDRPVVRTEPAPGSILLSLPVPTLVVVVGLVGLLLAYRKKNRLGLALAAAAIAAGAASFAAGSIVPKVEAQSQPSRGASGDSSVTQIDLGRQLFVAKGCITCHANNKVPHASDYWTIEMGAPDLTDFSASPEALRLRLKDPASVKSDTKMPNLNLSEGEIEALIAFINSK